MVLALKLTVSKNIFTECVIIKSVFFLNTVTTNKLTVVVLDLDYELSNTKYIMIILK